MATRPIFTIARYASTTFRTGQDSSGSYTDRADPKGGGQQGTKAGSHGGNTGFFVFLKRGGGPRSHFRLSRLWQPRPPRVSTARLSSAMSYLNSYCGVRPI